MPAVISHVQPQEMFCSRPHPQHPAPVAGKDPCRRGAAPPGQLPPSHPAVTMATTPPIPSSSLLPRRQPRLPISRVATVTNLPLPFGGGRRGCHGNELLSVATATASALLPCCHGNGILPTPSCPPTPPLGRSGAQFRSRGARGRPKGAGNGTGIGTWSAAGISAGTRAGSGREPGTRRRTAGTAARGGAGSGAALPVLPRASPARPAPAPPARFHGSRRAGPGHGGGVVPGPGLAAAAARGDPGRHRHREVGAGRAAGAAPGRGDRQRRLHAGTGGVGTGRLRGGRAGPGRGVGQRGGGGEGASCAEGVRRRGRP